MELKFIITQESKNGTVSFRAAKVVNIGGADPATVSKDIAGFSKAVIELVQKNKANGYGSAFSGIKKSLPLSISIQSVDVDDDINLRLDYKNFGRFLHEANQTQIESFIKDQIEFQDNQCANTEF